MPTQNRSGFTLVEIMIVVLIIGILLAIAIPNFLQVREASRAKSCIASLSRINSAKLQCTIDYQLPSSSTATFKIDGTTATTTGPNGTYQLVDMGANIFNYLHGIPSCPSGGVYTPGAVIVSPTCSVTGVAGSGYARGERWYHGY